MYCRKAKHHVRNQQAVVILHVYTRSLGRRSTPGSRQMYEVFVDRILHLRMVKVLRNKSESPPCSTSQYLSRFVVSDQPVPSHTIFA
ncbi:hypothetical protein Mapa_016216 [Marchantia paleacea]|nr:hypothetical protein Mapa_016216 [Marchantia paleacea]